MRTRPIPPPVFRIVADERRLAPRATGRPVFPCCLRWSDGDAQPEPLRELATRRDRRVGAVGEGGPGEPRRLVPLKRTESRGDLVTLNRLVVRFLDGTPDLRTLDPGLALLLSVDDPSEPRARVRPTDLVRQRGERPLNLGRGAGQVVRIVLIDPSGAWKQGGPRLELALGW